MVNIKNVSKTYIINDENRIKALQNVNINLKNEGLVFILGKSGSGKTTLLNIIGGIDYCDKGSIIIDSQDVSKLSGHEWDNFRNKNIGFVFQEYNLIESLSVYDNLLIALGITNIDEREHSIIVNQALSYVELDGYEYRKIKELSVGQKQRVAIARAIIKNPKILIADEPTGSLDQFNAREVFKLFEKISKTCLVIIVSHDRESSLQYADQIIEIADGCIINDFKQKKTYSSYYLLNIKNNSNKQLFEDTLVSDNYDLFKVINNLMNYLNTDCSTDNKWKFELLVESKNRDNEIQNNYYLKERKELIPKKLPRSTVIKLSKNSVSSRKKRLLANIVMFTLTLFLISMAMLFAFYDVKLPISKYISQSNYTYLTLAEETVYVDKFYREHYNLINRGEQLHQVFKENYGENRIFPFFSNSELKYENNKFNNSINNVNIIVLNDQSTTYFQLTGRIPNKENEILITDYVSYLFNLSEPIGRMINYDGVNMEIVGVIKTDYLKYGIIEKLATNLVTDFTSYKIVNEYKIAYIHEDTVKIRNKAREVIKLPISNFTHYNNESRYLSSYLVYGSNQLMERCELIWGKTPNQSNEILIHISLAETLGFSTDIGFSGFPSYKYLDLESQEYNSFYKGEINLYKYQPNEIKVVGIFRDLPSSGLTEIPHVLINDKMYKDIENEYFSYYIYSGYYIATNEEYYKGDIDSLSKSNLIWDEPSAKLIYDFKKAADHYLNYLIVIIIILLTLTLMMNITLISSTIFDSSKIIGILRAIGVRRIDTLKIFLNISIIIGVTSSIFSIVLTILGVSQVNLFYRLGLEENKFDILIFRPELMILIIFVCILLNIISAIIPIIILSKKKVVQLFH